MDDNRTAKIMGCKLPRMQYGDDGTQTSYKKAKLLSTYTEMSGCYNDLTIKYNAYYIPTLSAWALAEKALIPNYYPVLRSP
jgi:hypothetical protein